MICFPNAKINLGLYVVERRPDGYHNLETVFYPIGWKDALEVVPHPSGKDFELHVTGEDTPCESEKNLVTKVFRKLQQSYNLKPTDCYLKKAVPTGAGLGGGSSDAAHMLRLLNEVNDLGMDDEAMKAFIAQIGADCAFFIQNKPIFATGIGNQFAAVDLDLGGYFLVLVKPAVSVPTTQAYAMVKPVRPPFSLAEKISEPVETWKEWMLNDFEESVFHAFPEIASIKERLYAEGALYASMSGSGSSVFGLFREPVDLKPAFPGCILWTEILPNRTNKLLKDR